MGISITSSKFIITVYVHYSLVQDFRKYLNPEVIRQVKNVFFLNEGQSPRLTRHYHGEE